MRFLPLVLLLAAAILSGCGGDGSAPAPTPSLSSSVNYPGDQVGLASFSANFDAPHNGSTPSPAYVEVGWDRAAYISVS